MPLSLYRRLTSLALTPTTTSIQLADCSIRQPVGILEDLPVRVGEFVIPCDFFVVDMEESPHTPIILGRPFLATAGAKINMQAGTLSSCICGERVDFYFSPLIPTPAPATSTPPQAPVPANPLSVSTTLEVFDGDGGPDIWPPRYATSAPISTSGDVLDPIALFYTFPSAPPESPLSTIWK